MHGETVKFYSVLGKTTTTNRCGCDISSQSTVPEIPSKAETSLLCNILLC